MKRSTWPHAPRWVPQYLRKWNICFQAVTTLFLCMAAGSVGAEGPFVDWVRVFGGSGYEVARRVSVHASGVYLVGDTTVALEGESNLGVGEDSFVRKYDRAGNVLWTRQFGTPQSDRAFAVSTHATGIYVVGQTDGALPGQTSISPADVFVRKYDFDGIEVWTRQFGTTMGDIGTGAAVDDSGVYVAGSVGRALPGQEWSGNLDGFIRKYDFDGNEIWTRQFGTEGGSGAINVRKLVIGPSGLYVAGLASGPLPGQLFSGTSDGFLRKYDRDGNVIWTRQFGGPYSDAAEGAAVGISHVCVAGSYNPGFGGFAAYVRAYDLNGTELWVRQFGHSTSGNFAQAFDVDVRGMGVYVTGQAQGLIAEPPSQDPYYAYVRKYDLDGNEIWTTRIDTVAGVGVGEAGRGISVDATGVFVSGENGPSDAFVAKIVENQPPVAEAGDTQSVHVGGTVQLDGSSSYDEETASEDLLYAWQFTSVPPGSTATLTGAGTVKPTFVVDALGTYIISLVVTDAGGLQSEADEVTISSVNGPPNADAGPDQGTYVGARVTLDGSMSSDPDNDPLSYAWTMISAPMGSSVTLSNPDTVSPFFYPDVPGAYDIGLVVNDGTADSSPDTTTVLVAAVDDHVCGRTTEALNLVTSLPAGSFTNKGNQTALENLLKLACENAQKGNFNQAQHKLDQAQERTDGCVLRGAPDVGGGGSGTPPAKDYIIDCADQAAVYMLIQKAHDALTSSL